MKIIKLFPIKIVITIKLFLIDNFVILQKEVLSGLRSFLKVIQRSQQKKIEVLRWEKRREKKKSNYLGSKILSSSNMDTKNVTEEEKVICFYFQNLAMWMVKLDQLKYSILQLLGEFVQISYLIQILIIYTRFHEITVELI